MTPDCIVGEAVTPDVSEGNSVDVDPSRLMQPEVTQYLMRATAELAELLGIAV